MKKVTFVTNIPSPYRLEFFDQLGQLVDLTVIFEAERNYALNEKWYTDKIRTFKAIFLKKGAIEERKINWKILKYISRKQDVLIFTNYSCFTEMAALLWAKLRRIPYWMELDGALLRKEGKVKHWVKSFLIRGAQQYLSSSENTDRVLEHYGVNKNKIQRYPFTSVSECQVLDHVPTKEKKEKLRQQLGMTEGKIIISVGQFIHRKGFDILLHTAAQLPKDIGVYIIGGKPTDDYLQIKKEMNLQRVHFVDFMPTDQLSKYYQAADAFVFPTREDIWGLVVNEAMANGLPVITTERCVAGLELVKNGENGYIVPVDDADALAEAVTKFYAGDMRSMAEEALRAIRGYTIEEMAKKHLRLMNFDNNLGIKYDEL